MEDFEALYHRHADAVFRFACRAVGRRDLAEDLTSDAFIALLREGDRRGLCEAGNHGSTAQHVR